MRRGVASASCAVGLCLAALCMNRGEGASLTPVEKDDTYQVLNRAPVPPGTPTVPQAVFELPPRVASFGKDEFSPCYADLEKKILYRWRGVFLTREQIQKTPYCGVPSGIRLFDAKDFTVKTVEAAVRYREVDGQYRPGYLDRTITAFYEWKGVVLSKDELLDKSQDGTDPIVKPAFGIQPVPQVFEIEMPAFLKNQPKLWKK